MYDMGHCRQTGKQLMVKDSSGRFNSIKPDAWEAELVFESGSHVRVLLCKEACDNPDIEKIYENLLHPASGSFLGRPKAKEAVESFGKPVALTNKRRYPLKGKWVGE